MPKLKASATEQRNRQTQAMIDYGMSRYKLGWDDLGKVMQCDPRTVRHKRQYPETLNLADLRALIKCFKFTEDQAMELLGVENEI